MHQDYRSVAQTGRRGAPRRIAAVASACFLWLAAAILSAPGAAVAQDAAKSDADTAHEEIYIEDIYPSAKTCAACHPKQYSEWAVSQHAYAQMSPIYMAMQMRINTLTSGTNGDFCIRCHNQIGMNAGESVNTSNLERPDSSREGITCSVCHRVNKSYGKISGRLPLVQGPMHTTIFGPTGSPKLQDVIGDKEGKGFRVVTDPAQRGLVIHGEAEEFFELTQPGFCGTCHDVTLLNGFRLEEAFSEFKQTGAAADGVTCQDCHMGTEQGKPSGYDFGPAAEVNGIPTESRRITNHFFAGPDYSLIHPGIFPHNVEAADLAPLDEWLKFKWRSAWGTDDFEDMADIGQYAMDDMEEALATAADDVAAGDKPDLGDAKDALAELGEAVEMDAGQVGADAYDMLVAKVNALEAAAAPTTEQVQDAMTAAAHLRAKLDLVFPDYWTERVDREDARLILDDQQDRLDWAEEKRYEVMRNGYHLGEIEVEKVGADGIDFGIDVINATDGHGVPTGFDAERLVFLQVTVTDSEGKAVYLSGDRDPNGDVRDAHSLYVHNGELPRDEDLFNLQSKFIVRLFRGGEREQVLAVNTSVSALPFVRPETRATVIYGRPNGARKHKKTIEPLGTKRASYGVDGDVLKPGETYTINVKLIAQMIPVHLIAAIQESGFDYGMTPKELAERTVEQAMMLWERETVVTLGGQKQAALKQ